MLRYSPGVDTILMICLSGYRSCSSATHEAISCESTVRRGTTGLIVPAKTSRPSRSLVRAKSFAAASVSKVEVRRGLRGFGRVPGPLQLSRTKCGPSPIPSDPWRISSIGASPWCPGADEENGCAGTTLSADGFEGNRGSPTGTHQDQIITWVLLKCTLCHSPKRKSLPCRGADGERVATPHASNVKNFFR
jgi:hypothetical protein